MSGDKPPRLALWLHERSLPRDEREAVIGDLLEGYTARLARDPREAQRWVWSQTRQSLAPNLWRRCIAPRLVPAVENPQGGRMLNGFVTDLRFAIRLLRRQPLSSAIALASLTAALALNVLLVTLADAALVRNLPLRSPSDLVLVQLQRESGVMHNLSYLDYRDLRDRAQTVEALVAYAPVSATIDGTHGALPVDGEVVSGNFFAALGVRMRAGRSLGDADDRANSPRAVVISERLWRERFGSAAPQGQAMLLNGQPYSVVGVAESRFVGMQIGQHASFWVALAHSAPVVGGDHLPRRTMSWLTVIGRLRPNGDAAGARAELDGVLRAIRTETKGQIEPVVLAPGGRGDSVLSTRLASPLTLLLAAGLIVLLVACVNVANLQLARTDDRQAELAVRAALGASRTKLARLVAIDALVLTAVAGICGTLLATWLKDPAASLIAFYGQPVALDVPLDLRAVGAGAGVSIVAALAIALLAMGPVFRRSTASLSAVRTASTARPAMQRGLVVLQIALSMALVTGAALLVGTVDRLRHADLGFEPAGVAVVHVSTEMGRLTRAQSPAYFDEVVRTVTALPGVAGAAVAHVMPLDFGGSRMTMDIAGYTPAPDEDMELNFTRITPGYFAAMGVPILQGRAFDERDRDGQPERIIVNETMARRYWPDGGAVGALVRADSRQPYAMEVVGVVPDVHYRMVREDPRPSFYVPLAQYPSGAGVVHVRFAEDVGSRSAAGRIDELRRVVGAVNPAVPILRAHTLLDQIERNIGDERMATAVSMVLAAVALLLATGGLYGTMAFVVGRRTREIGLRMALGARTTDVHALVMREGVLLAALGVVGGLALSAWAGRALRGLLFGIDSSDPMSLAAAAASIAAAALLASWIPARRASRVDPVVALRDE